MLTVKCLNRKTDRSLVIIRFSAAYDLLQYFVAYGILYYTTVDDVFVSNKTSIDNFIQPVKNVRANIKLIAIAQLVCSLKPINC